MQVLGPLDKNPKNTKICYRFLGYNSYIKPIVNNIISSKNAGINLHFVCIKPKHLILNSLNQMLYPNFMQLVRVFTSIFLKYALIPKSIHLYQNKTKNKNKIFFKN